MARGFSATVPENPGANVRSLPMAGRPPKPIAADALPHAARVGGGIRRRRLAPLAQLGLRAGYSPQHVSGLELAKGTITRECLAAIDAALGADGALLELLPA